MYTKKQRDLLAIWQTNMLKRINLLEGSASSGKTWISLVLWALWVSEMPKDGLYMMCAKSLTTLKRNCLILLQDIIGEKNFSFSVSAKEGKLFGRKILLEGANDIRSESKIRGITLQGAYCDELTQFPYDFFTMLLSRLRRPGAKLIATTNPDSPSHWLKTEYIDRADELSFLGIKFYLDDNTTLPEDYVKNIKQEYTGVFYDRFILGKWTMAEGMIYPMYREALTDAPIGEITDYSLSIDYGTLNAFSAGLWGKYEGTWYRLKEFYYSGRDTGIQKTDEDYANELDRFIAPIMKQRESQVGKTTPYLEKMETIIDPSAASFITLLRRRPWYRIKEADNAISDGIRETASALATGKIKIFKTCKNWIKEAGGYVWDNNPVEDKPVKENDHAMDDTRYFVKTKGIAKHRSLYTPVIYH